MRDPPISCACQRPIPIGTVSGRIANGIGVRARPLCAGLSATVPAPDGEGRSGFVSSISVATGNDDDVAGQQMPSPVDHVGRYDDDDGRPERAWHIVHASLDDRPSVDVDERLGD